MCPLPDNDGRRDTNSLFNDSISVDYPESSTHDATTPSSSESVYPDEQRSGVPWAIIIAFFVSYALLMFLPFFMILLPLALGGWLIYWTLKNPGEAARKVRLAVMSALIFTAAASVLFFQTNKAQMEASFPVFAGVGITLLTTAIVGTIIKTRRG